MKFQLKSQYQPAGDQPQAIKGLVSGLQKGFSKQTLLGVTGSGKTFTMANVIEQVQMPTLVIAHNKTLAAQLCNEFRNYFPNNAVEYFVSYYDYYQPEAYMPGSDTYIEKEAQINDEIDRLRHACTQALLSRQDVIIVASVSCIYGLGSPKEYEQIVLHLIKGQQLDRRAMLEQLIAMQFERTNADLKRGTFRLKGQVFEVMPVNEEYIYRLEISDTIDVIERLDPVTRQVLSSSEVDQRGPSARQKPGLRAGIRPMADAWFFPARHYVVGEVAREKAFKSIKVELKERLDWFEKKGKLLEHERLKRRVTYDLEMIKNLGYCSGIENYSRHFEGRQEGEPGFTLLDYFAHTSGNQDFLTIIDESHVTTPQIRAMYRGDRARKETLAEHGFRLPSAKENRPLQYEEFEERVGQTVYVSATPSEYEIKESKQVVEQVVRPTGLIDPEVVVRPITPGRGVILSEGAEGDRPKDPLKLRLAKPLGSLGYARDDSAGLSQVEDLIKRIELRVKNRERVLVTTLTKKMAEDLSEYLEKKKIKVKYLHSDIKTIERIEVITELRLGKIDVIVGVNLLREGLDMPEVSLVAILDADKEGFLRSETSLIQTIGRAARNVNGRVVLYADEITGSIQRAIDETQRRRKIQLAYNKKHGITPATIDKAIKNILEEFGIDASKAGEARKARKDKGGVLELDLKGDARPLNEIIKDKEEQMKEAAKKLDFELAAILRDELRELSAREKTRK